MSEGSRWRVWVSRTQPDQADLKDQIQQMADWLHLQDRIQRNTRVALKPNLTYSFYKKGVTTSPLFLEAVVAALREITTSITIVESNGGSNAWQAEEAFERHGIYEICRKYGAKAVNLTRQPRQTRAAEIAGRTVEVELPTLLLEETDYFITLPVPKVHVMTRVSLGFKNQWGCLPDVKRCLQHPEFRWKILAIHKLLDTKLAIFDGQYFLNRTGPMEGDPVEMNLVVAGEVGSSSRVCCALMGIDPITVSHLALAMKEGLMPRDLSDVQTNVEDLQRMAGQRFYMKRTPLNYVTLGVFKSKTLARTVYASPLAKPIHEILYFVRGRPKDLSPKW